MKSLTKTKQRNYITNLIMRCFFKALTFPNKATGRNYKDQLPINTMFKD
jgi:hypothetical protein